MTGKRGTVEQCNTWLLKNRTNAFCTGDGLYYLLDLRFRFDELTCIITARSTIVIHEQNGKKPHAFVRRDQKSLSKEGFACSSKLRLTLSAHSVAPANRQGSYPTRSEVPLPYPYLDFLWVGNFV